MSISSYKWQRSLANAWLFWSQEASPLFDPEKASRLWDRSGTVIAVELVRMGLRGLLPEDVEVTS